MRTNCKHRSPGENTYVPHHTWHLQALSCGYHIISSITLDPEKIAHSRQTDMWKVLRQIPPASSTHFWCRLATPKPNITNLSEIIEQISSTGRSWIPLETPAKVRWRGRRACLRGSVRRSLGLGPRLVLPLATWVTEGKSLNISALQFPDL